MSKARRKALDEIKAAIESETEKPPVDAIITLIEDGLSSLERIALALEGRTELTQRAVEALEKLAKASPT